MNIVREKIANGVYFSHVKVDKYKSGRLIVNLISPITKENITKRSLLASMLRQCSEEFESFSELNIELSYLYGASVYSDTAKIGDSYVLTIGSSFLNDNALPEGVSVTGRIAEIVSGMIFKPKISDGSFSEETLAVEKENLKEAILSEMNDKRRYAARKAIETYFGEDGYAIPVDGYVEALKDINGKNLYEEYKKLLKEASVEIVYDGFINPEKIKSLFAEGFSKISDRNPYVFQNKEAIIKPKFEISENSDVKQAKEVMLFVCPKGDNATLKLLSAIYGGTPFSFLFKEVREKKSLCYYCSSSYVRSKKMLIVESGVDNSKTKAAEKEILEQFERVRRGEFSDSDLSNTKQYLVGLYKTIEDAPSTYLDRYLSDIVLQSDNIEKEAEKINSVSREDLISAAKEATLVGIYSLGNFDNE